MSCVRFIVDKKLNLFCHFMICTDIHRYLRNRYYKQENYALFNEDEYEFFREDLRIYCLELLLKIVSDHPDLDTNCLKRSFDSYLFAFLDKRAKQYLAYWKKRESQLLALKQCLEKEWSAIEEKLQRAIEKVMREKFSLDDLRIFLVDAFYGRKEGEGSSSTAEVNMVDNNLLLIFACEPEQACSLFRIIVHEIIHKPLSRIIGQLQDEMELRTDEITIVSETFARLIEKEVCTEIGIQPMTEEEIRKNTERFGFLDFYLQTSSVWQDYIEDTSRSSLREFIKWHVEQNTEVLKKCEYSSSFL